MNHDRRAFVAALGGCALLAAACSRGPELGPTLRAPETREPPDLPPPAARTRFPLRLAPGARHLVDAAGAPYFLVGDSPWSIEVQLTRAQVSRYLDDRAARGFNAIMFEAIEHFFSSQTPAWRNAAGDSPFAADGTTDRGVDRYWQHVDHVVGEANRRGIVCVVHPAYLGYGGGEEGWTAEVLASTEPALAAYGAWLGRRYRGCGVIWCMGGDYDGAAHPGLVARQWRIADGLLQADPSALVTAHAARRIPARAVWGDRRALALDTFYTAGLEFPDAAAAYRDAAARPFLHIEGHYENHLGAPADCRREAYVSLLTGACGHFYGNAPLWGFGEPRSNGGRGAADALDTALDTPGARQMARFATFVGAHAWWTLVPDLDGAVLMSAPGEGVERVCAAASRDRALTMVWSTGRPFAVRAEHIARRRARWFDTVQGTWAAARPAGEIDGAARFTPPGERVLVVDGAPTGVPGAPAAG